MQPSNRNMSESNYTRRSMFKLSSGMTFPTNQIDNYNVDQPTYSTLQTLTLSMSNTLFKNYWLTEQQNFYDTDYCIVFADDIVGNFFTFESQSSNVSMSNSLSELTFPTNMGYIVFQTSPTIMRYHLSFISSLFYIIKKISFW